MIYQPTNIWGKIISLPDDVNIGTFCDIGEPDIGTGCKIQTGVSIPPGWKIGNNVFIGPGARLCNDMFPKAVGAWEKNGGTIEDGASIGIAAVLLAGITIGAGALIGAGSVVTKSVPAKEIWVGNPAKFLRVRDDL